MIDDSLCRTWNVKCKQQIGTPQFHSPQVKMKTFPVDPVPVSNSRKGDVLIWLLCCGAFGLVSSSGPFNGLHQGKVGTRVLFLSPSSSLRRNLIYNTLMVVNSIFCHSIPHDRLYRDKMSTLHAWPPRTITFGVFTSHFWSLETEVHNEIWAHAEGITNWKQLPLGAFQSNPCYAAQAFHIVCIQCRTRGTSDSNTRSGKAMFYLRQCISI